MMTIFFVAMTSIVRDFSAWYIDKFNKEVTDQSKIRFLKLEKSQYSLSTQDYG